MIGPFTETQLIRVAAVAVATGVIAWAAPRTTALTSKWRGYQFARWAGHAMTFLSIFVGASLTMGILFPNVPIVTISTLGLAVSLGVQGILSQFVAGAAMVWTREFDLGDWITVVGVTGKVDDFGATKVRLIMASGDVVQVPNNTIQSNPVVVLHPDTISRLQREPNGLQGGLQV